MIFLRDIVRILNLSSTYLHIHQVSWISFKDLVCCGRRDNVKTVYPQTQFAGGIIIITEYDIAWANYY